MTDAVTDAERTLCRLLTGALGPADVPDTVLTGVWQHAEDHGGAELLAAVLTAADVGVPGPVRDRASACLRAAAVAEMLRHRRLLAIAEAFDRARIRLLLIKGAALAYTVYPQPYLRPACDIDLFIPRDSLDVAEAALASIGFERQVEPDAESASMQRHYRLRDALGAEHYVDLHWRVANRHLFAQAIEFEHAWKASQPVPRLSAAARTLGTADALLLACIHRIAHHGDSPDLIWLWDIHLLSVALTRTDVEMLAASSAAAQMRTVTARGLTLSHDRFGTVLDPWLMQVLGAGAGEPSAALIGRRTRHARNVMEDLTALRTYPERLRLLREHLCPSLTYMRARYPSWPRVALPFAYVYRILRGAPKWFGRSA